MAHSPSLTSNLSDAERMDARASILPVVMDTLQSCHRI